MSSKLEYKEGMTVKDKNGKERIAIALEYMMQRGPGL